MLKETPGTGPFRNVGKFIVGFLSAHFPPSHKETTAFMSRYPWANRLKNDDLLS
jgi:hypothetical protein